MLHHFDFFMPSGLDKTFNLTDDELADQLDGTKASTLFLGSYSMERISDALARFGITDKLNRQGYTELHISYAHHGPYAYKLLIENGPEGARFRLGEIVVKEGNFSPKTDFIPGHNLQQMDLLVIEWMLMQDERGEFSEARPRLPGQNHPGLGVGKEVVRLLDFLTEQQSKEGLLNFPEYFNNAVIYSEFFDFFDPRKQAEMLALWRDLSEAGMNLAQASWAVYFECVHDAATGEVVKWFAEEQIKAHSPRIKAYFADPEYPDAVQTYLENMRFELDTGLYEQKLKTIDKIDW